MSAKSNTDELMTPTALTWPLHSERIYAGSLMASPEVADMGLELLDQSHLLSHFARMIYAAVSDLREKKWACNAAEVLLWLRQHGFEKQFAENPTLLLIELSEEAGSGANISQAAYQIREAATRRSVLAFCTETIRDMRETPTPVNDLLAQIDVNYNKVTEVESSIDPQPVSKTIRQTLKNIELVQTHKKPKCIARTGFERLDQGLGGFQPGTLLILAARPSVGKTALAGQFATNVAAQGKNVLFFSLEMTREELELRMLANRCKVSLNGLQGERPLTDDECRKLSHEGSPEGLAGLPLSIECPKGAITANQLANQAKRYAARHNTKLIIIDYLTLLEAERHTLKDNRALQVGTMSRRLKQLARETGAAVLCLAQLNRAVESRGGVPTLADLRDSGEIEQDADVVLMLHRASQQDEFANLAKTQVVELHIRKQRNGPLGFVQLIYHGKETRFEEPLHGEVY